MSHRLAPLLTPKSIAVVGASRRAGVGREILVNLQAGQFPGQLFAVNPGYDSVEGIECFASLADLPMQVEHVIFAVGDQRIEPALEDAIAHGCKAATIFSSLILAADTEPPLSERVRQRALETGLLLAGGNGMGFYNFRDRVWNCGFDTRHNHAYPGNVTLISQSGSGMSGILDCEERIAFNFAVSTGQELVLGLEDYLDYVLDLPETRVVGLFMETSRQPERLLRALEKANQRKIPIVVLKVGRTELAAKLAVSHSGALVGSDASYQAVFDRYGVQRVADMDQLATALIMFAQPHEVGDGGVVSVHDSGGERQLFIDLADQYGVALTNLGETAVARLQQLLDPGLPAVNPLDAWSSGGSNHHEVMAESFSALLCDPGTAFGAVVHDRAPYSQLCAEYADYLRRGLAASGKPVFLVASRQGTGADEAVQQLTAEGMPVLDGVSQFLVGARCLINWRRFLSLELDLPPPANEDFVALWRERIQSGESLDETMASEMLTDFGLPMLRSLRVSNTSEVFAAAGDIDYPVVLKTAMPGVHHKSDVVGVVLGIANRAALVEAYRDMAARLGPEAMIAPMVLSYGMEMILGVSRDAQFGPVVALGFGGIYTEVMQDFVSLYPPFGAGTAAAAIERLNMAGLLKGGRGKPPLNVAALAEAAARLSVLAVTLADVIAEIDINPVLVTTESCLGLDALVIRHHDRGEVSWN